jgi:hypothetical protein
MIFEYAESARPSLTDAGLLKVCRCEFVTHCGSFSHSSAALDHLPEVPAECWNNVLPPSAYELHSIRPLEVGALAFADREDKTPGPKGTANFVLEAHIVADQFRHS